MISRAVAIRVSLLPALLLCAPASCSRDDTPPAELLEYHSVPVRDVRVLVGSNVTRARLRSPSGVSVTDSSGVELATEDDSGWLVAAPRSGGGIALGSRSWPLRSVTVAPLEGSILRFAHYREDRWSEETPYPGVLRFTVNKRGALDVVNLIDVERYVASVVACEVWPTFDVEAYRAQAIAARTYVLFEMIRRRGMPWDVAATQGSQVYKGLRSDGPGRRAAAATRFTHGIACTFSDSGADRLFPTFYSSVCGGMTQSAAIFGKDNAIEPLAGGVRCDDCRIAPKGTYRWGPVRVSLKDVESKLRARYPKLLSLGELVKVEVVEYASAGGNRRPTRLRLSGSTGRTHEIGAEQFRVVIGGMVMRSTDCRIRTDGDEVVFENGRGFGHGLGLCQWGMQGKALAGVRAGEILRDYFPGSRLTRVY